MPTEEKEIKKKTGNVKKYYTKRKIQVLLLRKQEAIWRQNNEANRRNKKWNWSMELHKQAQRARDKRIQVRNRDRGRETPF